MNTLQAFSYLTSVIYLVLAGVQSFHLYGKITFSKNKLLFFGLSAACLHAIILHRFIDTPFGQNLSSTNIISLVSWLMVVITLTSSIGKPIENLTVFILPVAAFSIPLALNWPGNDFYKTVQYPKSLVHILISIAAFSILGLAALQALLLFMQNHLLRSKKPSGMINILPPLQTMESLLFQIIWIGFLFLSASLWSAYLCLTDSIITPPIEKIVFSMLAWILFGILIYGRHHSGWRGLTAVRWTLSGIALLSIAYFGSKLVFT